METKDRTKAAPILALQILNIIWKGILGGVAFIILFSIDIILIFRFCVRLIFKLSKSLVEKIIGETGNIENTGQETMQNNG